VYPGGSGFSRKIAQTDLAGNLLKRFQTACTVLKRDGAAGSAMPGAMKDG
jgi:hypothetical protein